MVTRRNSEKIRPLVQGVDALPPVPSVASCLKIGKRLNGGRNASAREASKISRVKFAHFFIPRQT